jgi:hypothetical protein
MRFACDPQGGQNYLIIAAMPPCRRLGVVTSDFHMPRSRAIFETCFRLAGAELWTDPDRCRRPCMLNMAV